MEDGGKRALQEFEHLLETKSPCSERQSPGLEALVAALAQDGFVGGLERLPSAGATNSPQTATRILQLGAVGAF